MDKRVPWNKGLKTSDETKEKQRQAKLKNPTKYWLGKTKSKEHIEKFIKSRKGIPAWNKGKKMSEELKKKLSFAKIGRKILSDEHYKNLSLKFKGSGGSNWRGGLTSLSIIIRNCFKYRQWRSDIFTRDNFICQECYKTKTYLEAHHIKFFHKIIKEYNIKSLNDAENCEELWNLNNGITLCKECHNKHKKYQL